MLNIAHRGGAGLRPENTLSAFEFAIVSGTDGAELDVQLSRDGEVVVFHDYRLKPEICRGPEGAWLSKPTPRIKDLSLSELRGFDVGRHDPGSQYGCMHGPSLMPVDGQRIPTLAEVIMLARQAPKPFWLFIELKSSWADRDVSADPRTLADAALRVVRENNYLDRTIFVGFDWPALLRIKEMDPAMPCWFTTLARSWFEAEVPPPEDDPPAAPALQMLRELARRGTSPWAGGYDAVNYGGSILRAIKAAGGDGWFPPHRDVTASRVAEARALDLKVGAWTVNEQADIERLTALGLDALCTDRPDVVARYALPRP